VCLKLANRLTPNRESRENWGRGRWLLLLLLLLLPTRTKTMLGNYQSTRANSSMKM